MMDEALSGAGTQRSPEPGWYPDPVGRAAHRYWNGTEWTANTRGPAASPTPGGAGSPDARVEKLPETKIEARAVPVTRPVAVEVPPVRPADPKPAEPTRAETPASVSKPVEPETKAPVTQESVASTQVRPTPERSLFSASPESSPSETPRSATPSAPTETAATPRVAPAERTTPSAQQPSVTPPSSETPPVVATAEEGGSHRLASVLGALLIASVAFAGGLAVQRFVLDDQAAQAAATPTTQATTTTAPSTTTTDDQAAETAAQLEALEAELAVVTAERDEALAAAATGTDTAALEAQVANLQTHVDTMRGWFTTAILDTADAAFEAEVARACAAEAEPTLDNTNYTNRMEPAGTHADIVAAALACRSEDG